MQELDKKTGRATVQAAKAFSAKVERAGGFQAINRTEQIDGVRKARSFCS